MPFFFVFVTSFLGEYPNLGYIGPGWSSSAFRCARSWSRKSTLNVHLCCVVLNPYTTEHDVDKVVRVISGSSDLTWVGASESNSRRRVEREGQRKMKWAGSSGAVRHSLQVESPGAVLFILRRNLEASASRFRRRMCPRYSFPDRIFRARRKNDLAKSSLGTRLATGGRVK